MSKNTIDDLVSVEKRANTTIYKNIVNNDMSSFTTKPVNAIHESIADLESAAMNWYEEEESQVIMHCSVPSDNILLQSIEYDK